MDSLGLLLPPPLGRKEEEAVLQCVGLTVGKGRKKRGGCVDLADVLQGLAKSDGMHCPALRFGRFFISLRSKQNSPVSTCLCTVA